ncbi:hypothetical protein [Oscillatoria sp. FACHB-1406]|uniref:hypothetical protein n=1 Tax=Oscillatoria sp. FACHB-1406 TaxID=2692846 RepID=UPI00168792C8|nr:hypothetical protein [Oscillatoria sp. FACHB-1406]MBD2580387.1 hypothetical protein [Oscillatoria sp. FACHB-1406]
MNLDDQVQLLLNNAPEDENVRNAMARAVGPVLKSLASRMQHLNYFVIRGTESGFLITTLSNRTLPQVEKRAIYAFSSEKDARAFPSSSHRDCTVESLPVTHILFQILALESVDSIIFLETSGQSDRGVEIRRRDLQQLVQQQLQKFQRARNIPPDLA